MSNYGANIVFCPVSGEGGVEFVVCGGVILYRIEVILVRFYGPDAAG